MARINIRSKLGDGVMGIFNPRIEKRSLDFSCVCCLINIE